MDDKRAVGAGHSEAKAVKKSTGSGLSSGAKEQHQKKKIKLDRSTLIQNEQKPKSLSLSNGIKTELKSPANEEKIKHIKVNSSLKGVKKESPVKLQSTNPGRQTDSDDDTPLAARTKIKVTSPMKSPSSSKVHSTNGETFKSKSDHVKSSLKSPTKGQSNGTSLDSVNKIKSPTSSKEQFKTKSDGVKIVKSDSSSSGSPKLTSPKVEGVKKIKSESKVLTSPKVGDKDGIKKIKSESSSKSDKIKKIKTESGVSSKTDGVNKMKSNKGLSSSPQADGVNKIKSMGSPSNIGEVKKIKSESSVHKVKVKTEKRESSSSAMDGGKKRKSDSTTSSSPKNDSIKKIKITSSPNKLSTNVDGKKIKSSTEDSEDDMPLATRVTKVKKEPVSPNKERKRKLSDDEDEYEPLVKTKKKLDVDKKSIKKEKTKNKVKKEVKKEGKKEAVKKEPKTKKPEEEVWKWWEEEKHPEGVKWLTLEHKGPYFPPVYEPLPDSVKFYYDGKTVKLSEKAEEVAGFYAKMLDHEYTSKKIFNDNFFEDWRKEMNDEERKLIKDISKCGFQELHAYYVQKNEERKNMTKEDKQKLKEKNEQILQEYGYCMMDGHKERVGNFKIEPPGLFRGRGDHPKQGKFKKRVNAKDVIINIGKDAKVPGPPEGQKWKAVTYDNKVTWLACWIENIQGGYKYVMLNPTSRIKGEKDWQKYETARKLKTKVGKIRSDYSNDWRSKEMRLRQRGVALYFIDKLALRAGHEKDEDTADTVGCCSLRVEHIKLHREKDNKEYVVEFDFLGKDSIHYHNLVEVEKRVFKNLELFKQGKSDGDDLFDRLSTTSLNKYLSELMEGLSAKVFRTYNASMTLQEQLNKLEVEDNVASKVLGYNRANRAVAILCNHQRTAPKTFEQSMSNLQQKIEDKRKLIKEAKKETKDLKAEAKASKTPAAEKKYEKKKTTLARLQEQLFKLEVTQTDKEENKEIALGTSKLNYLDPRISIAWCRKNDVPIEKIYNKTQRQKFAWAIDMTEEDFVF